MQISRTSLNVPGIFGGKKKTPGHWGGTVKSEKVARKKRKPRYISGLDIGTTKVCAITAAIDAEGAITILGMGSAPSRGMRRGVVTNINETVEAVEKAYQQAFKLARVHPQEILVGIAGDHISGINAEGVVEVSNPNVGIDERDCKRARGKALRLILPQDVELLHSFIK